MSDNIEGRVHAAVDGIEGFPELNDEVLIHGLENYEKINLMMPISSRDIGGVVQK